MKDFAGQQTVAVFQLLLLAALLLPTPPLFAANSFWISTTDSASCIVSAVVQYNPDEEARIRRENGITEPVLVMDVHLRDPQDLCKLLIFRQESQEWRPTLCVTERKENIYHGYVVLPESFSLGKPITIVLGNRSVTAKFNP